MPDFSKITTFILDVDGVLTDGTVHSFADGEHARTFFIKDGYAMEKAMQSGYNITIISGGFEKGVENRLKFLGVKDIFLGVKDKLALFNSYKKEKNIKEDEILYMGDDIPDYKMLKLVGLPTCPNDAANDIKEICQYVSPYNGGRGAVRDVIEKVMKSQGKWLKEQW
ncbi:MAG TPA: HAD hydrolase family protein [Cytophagaceae bacterium]|jgi:3-deoxy-D-manno-octulosonate 8-phosphate phosphatase (KDO 8-P phosphatase)|nr:HAD hydrolase family protein [Cytophagaceae bacterium]